MKLTAPSQGLIATGGSTSPTGSAGGSLGGTYPNPTVLKIVEASGPTALTIGTIADGEFLQRVGATLVSAPVSSTDANAFHKTGDAFGADAIFGTTDNKKVTLKANNTTVATMLGNGAFLVGNTATQTVSEEFAVDGLTYLNGHLRFAASKSIGMGVDANGTGSFVVRHDVDSTASLWSQDNRHATGNPAIYIGNNPLGASTKCLWDYLNTDNSMRLTHAGAGDMTLKAEVGALILKGGNTTGMKMDSTGIGFYSHATVAQGNAVADASGGSTIDAEARAAINALLARIRATGLITT